MEIELKNIAVRVVNQTSIACMITISRLTDDQKKLLRGMFPSAISPSGEVDGCSEMTFTAGKPDFSSVRIHDSDMCNLVITDGMIESQRDTVYLPLVAVKVQPQSKTIRIGRISEGEKLRIERMLPLYKLNWISNDIHLYELTIHYSSDINVVDSNQCRLTIAYDETQSDSICILDQHLSVQNCPLSIWFNEENKLHMTIKLNNVAIKVQRQGKHECIISIGRLNDVEKDELLNMYPLAIHSLQCKNPIHYTPLFQMTITAGLPEYFKIFDSDACCLTITDRMITKIIQSKLTDSLCLANWFGSSDSKTSNEESKSKEENKMRIDLKNVAVKVERKHPHDCIISIGRLHGAEKNKLLNMFPTAINSLICVSTYPTLPLYQMTITVNLPDLPDFKICDNDVCDISIIDFMITLQTESSDKNMCKRNWFGGVDSVSDNGIKRVRLLYVAVKVLNKQGECNHVKIGRISGGKKERLEQIIPSNMLHFKSRRIPDSSIDQYELELWVPVLTDIEDSNNCAIEVLYDEKHPNLICISNQHLFSNHCFSPWFDSSSDSNDSNSDDSKSNGGIRSLRLLFVAAKVDNKRGKLKYIRIGRIGESDKIRLEQMLPSNMLNFKSRTIVTSTRSFNYYELDLPAAVLTTDIADSNYCAIDISYDERHPNVVSISDQRIIENHTTPQWFLSIAQRLAPPRVSIAQKVYETTQQMISQNKKEETNMNTVSLEKCIINDNATIFFWSDGTKTVTKTTPGDAFDPEVGIAMGIAKRLFGSKHKFDKFVNAVVSDMYKRNAAAFTEKELLDALAENEKIITKAKAKHNAEKAAYITAKNDPNHEGKLPVLHSLKGDHSYRFAKIRKDIILAEIEKRKEKKAAKAKAKAAKAKKSDKK